MVYYIRTFDSDLFKATWDCIDHPFESIIIPKESPKTIVSKIAHLLWFFNVFIYWKMFEDTFYDKF